jgi:hypothetical protein
MRAKYVVIGVVVGLLLSSAVIVLAGSQEPPSGPMDAASQMYTLEQIYDRLDTGAVSSKMTSFTEPDTGPGATGHTFDEVMDLAMAVGNPDPPCWNNTNRYVGCANGTVHDTVTNLIWLKNANCFGPLDYTEANNAAAGLEDGECGLTDGSSPGDWRLPTLEEWEAAVARGVVLGCTYPSLTNTPGTACFSAGPPPFTNVQSGPYWSSVAVESSPTYAWIKRLDEGHSDYLGRTILSYVWPVRGGPLEPEKP